MDKTFFYCYSTNLFQFLRNNKHIEYICTGKHIETDKQFWQFWRTESLLSALDEYRGKKVGSEAIIFPK